jgi:LytS/YehU family sensor histidine kinase
LIKLIQKGQLEKKYKAEKKINELQLSMLRNQLSDHFSLNAVNAVMYSVMSNKTDEACENLRKFAGLYKTLLLSAGAVLRKLSDEIEFCENYLSLEKSRFNGKFDFNIRVSPGVDKDFHVPVMSIHLYAENAVKHGLSPLKTKGILSIVVEQFANTLIIEINDNGVGREYAIKNPVKSTGKGLEMMNEFYSHLKTYHNYEVNAELTDLYDESDQPAGTKVELKITSGYA